MDLFQEIRLGLTRSDYMVDGATDMLLQVELNTISTSSNGLACGVSELHRSDYSIWNPIRLHIIHFEKIYTAILWIRHRVNKWHVKSKLLRNFLAPKAWIRISWFICTNATVFGWFMNENIQYRACFIEFPFGYSLDIVCFISACYKYITWTSGCNVQKPD